MRKLWRDKTLRRCVFIVGFLSGPLLSGCSGICYRQPPPHDTENEAATMSPPSHEAPVSIQETSESEPSGEEAQKVETVTGVGEEPQSNKEAPSPDSSATSIPTPAKLRAAQPVTQAPPPVKAPVSPKLSPALKSPTGAEPDMPEQTAKVAPVEVIEKPAKPPLDLEGLEKRLKETDAIGVFTKLALKNQVNDLMDKFRSFYRGRSKTSPAQLREPYELLIMKVLALLQDDDPKLARDLLESREAIWGILADPEQFARADS